MDWLHDVSYLFGGALLANAVPHFVSGMTGRPFQSPFARPPGKGLSSSTVNVIWGFANFVIAYLLIARVGNFDLHAADHVIAVGGGRSSYRFDGRALVWTVPRRQFADRLVTALWAEPASEARQPEAITLAAPSVTIDDGRQRQRLHAAFLGQSPRELARADRIGVAALGDLGGETRDFGERDGGQLDVLAREHPGFALKPTDALGGRPVLAGRGEDDQLASRHLGPFPMGAGR
jgi:hypothetical protein